MFNKGTRIAVIGENSFADSIIKKINQDKYYSITCKLTNMSSSTSGNLLPIYQIAGSRLLKKELFDEILILDDMPYKNEFYYDLFKEGYNKIYIMIKESTNLFNGKMISEECIQIYNLQEKPIMKYVEMHVTDLCNLNCKGCTHFANTFEKNETDYEKFCKDVDLLSKNYNIPIIRLMGGEALLASDLDRYICYVRKKFPKSKIFLVSNGLLIPSMNEKTCNSLKDNNIVVNITVYEPTYKNIANIEKYLNDKKIMHFYGQGHKQYSNEDIIKEFHTCLTLNNKKSIKNSGYGNCYGKFCWMVRNGLISKCCYPLLCYKLNEKFSTNFIVNKRDCYELTTTNNGWELIDKLSHAIPFCKYCSKRPTRFKWEGVRKQPIIRDFVKDE